jgi:glycosyltransferase involved in cell wall biosynthesis
MKISHYLEFEDRVLGGIRESVKNQRTAFERTDLEYVTDVKFSSDIWHLNFVGPISFIFAMIATLIRKPLIINVHTTSEDFKESFRFSGILSYPLYVYLKVFYSMGDKLIVPSDYTASLMKNDYGFTPEKLSVVSNGIETSKFNNFEECREEAREKYDLDGEVFFCVGSVFKRKGVPEFIDVARKFPEKDFVWFGKIFDDKIMDKEMKEAMSSKPGNVTFTGYVDDIREAYAAGDVFFYPTHTENQGIPALEAAYCEKPLILRDIPAFESDFEDGENCLKGDNLEEFYDCIERVSRDEELPSELVDNARDMVENHTLESIGKQLQDAYFARLENQSK